MRQQQAATHTRVRYIWKELYGLQGGLEQIPLAGGPVLRRSPSLLSCLLADALRPRRTEEASASCIPSIQRLPSRSRSFHHSSLLLLPSLPHSLRRSSPLSAAVSSSTEIARTAITLSAAIASTCRRLLNGIYVPVCCASTLAACPWFLLLRRVAAAVVSSAAGAALTATLLSPSSLLP